MTLMQEETYETTFELKELSDGTWEVKEIRTYKYTDPLEARNKIQEYIYNKINKENTPRR